MVIEGPNQITPRLPKKARQELPLIARVTIRGAPASGVSVQISLGPELDDDGGHIRHNETVGSPAGRPRGVLRDTTMAFGSGTASISGVTNAAGEFSFIYDPSEFSGAYKLHGTCAGCASVTVAPVKVWIQDLLNVPASSEWTLIGSTPSHPDNHFLTASALLFFENARGQWTKRFPSAEPWKLNDASLKWGGRFDLGHDWISPAHNAHREGKGMDIDANPLDANERDNFAKWARGRPVYGPNTALLPASPQVLWKVKGHFTHFHVEAP